MEWIILTCLFGHCRFMLKASDIKVLSEEPDGSVIITMKCGTEYITKDCLDRIQDQLRGIH